MSQQYSFCQGSFDAIEVNQKITTISATVAAVLDGVYLLAINFLTPGTPERYLWTCLGCC